MRLCGLELVFMGMSSLNAEVDAEYVAIDKS